MPRFVATYYNGTQHWFDSDNLETAKRDAWDAVMIDELSDDDIAEIERQAQERDSAENAEG